MFDPAGVWGLGVFEAADEDAARTMILEEPAIAAELSTFELHPIQAIVGGHAAG